MTDFQPPVEPTRIEASIEEAVAAGVIVDLDAYKRVLASLRDMEARTDD